MKYTQEEVDNGLLSIGQPNVVLKASECDLETTESSSMYNKKVFDYVDRYKVSIAKNLLHAIHQRRQRLRYASLRELDICSRNKYNLASEFAWEALFHFEAYFQEGHLNLKDNVWELRAQYNRCVHFYQRGENFKNSGGYVASTQKRKDECDKAIIDTKAKMDSILTLIEQIGLPAWPEEIKAGFPVEMTHPEFMTFEKYREFRTKYECHKTEHQHVFSTMMD